MLAMLLRCMQKPRVNWFKTFLINFRCLPWHQAVRLPIYIYSHTMLVSMGKIRIESRDVRRGMIRIGTRNFFSGYRTQWINSGLVVFKGRFLIEAGTCINNSGTVILGEESRFCENNKVLIVNGLTIGKSTQIAFDTVIMDTDFHTIISVEKGVAKKSYAPVVIGDYNWIGNRSLVKKGTVTPDYAIVSSMSMLNKDYTSAPPYPLLGGCPAKVLGDGWRRLYHTEHNREINAFFKEYPEAKEYRIPKAGQVTAWDNWCLHGDDRLPF